jgi:hypothetical protein
MELTFRILNSFDISDSQAEGDLKNLLHKLKQFKLLNIIEADHHT